EKSKAQLLHHAFVIGLAQQRKLGLTQSFADFRRLGKRGSQYLGSSDLECRLIAKRQKFQSARRLSDEIEEGDFIHLLHRLNHLLSQTTGLRMWLRRNNSPPDEYQGHQHPEPGGRM